MIPDGAKNALRAGLGKCLPLKPGVMNLVVTLIQLFYLASFLVSGIMPPSLDTILLMLASLAASNIFVLFANSALGRLRVAWVAFSLIFIFFFNGLYAYRLGARIDLDYGVMRDNFSSIIYPESMAFVVDALGLPRVLLAGAVMILLIVFEWRAKAISRQQQGRPVLPKLLVSAALYVLIVASPLASHDELAGFFRSAWSYYRGSGGDAGDGARAFSVVKTKPHDAMLPVVTDAPHEQAGMPDIFLVMQESFNANFVETRSTEGVEYTPYFNSLIEHGLYVERFYGNSMQTSKGQFATLFSVVPSIKGKVFVHFPERHFYSLPAMLRDSGYETIFFQANEDITFDNTKAFLSANGFSKVETVADHMMEGDKKSYWGWGLQDDVFYRRLFEYLDGLRAGGKAGGKPLFVLLASVMNHPRFDMVPKPKRELYPNALTPEQHYANSVHLMDKYLKVFFEELGKREDFRSAIVIVTGDHSYPVGEHGFYGSEESFYDEFFKIPFLLLWKDKVPPGRLSDAVYSQMDIAPTILDLLDLPVRKHHFEGVSIFDKKEAAHPVYLVQPYSGKYLSAISFPYKYTRHLREENEFLFDLKHDPKETKNLAGFKEYETILADLRRKLEFIFINQKLIEEDEIWPEGERGQEKGK